MCKRKEVRRRFEGAAFADDPEALADVIARILTPIGLSPDASASWQLTRRIGPTRAKELFLTNRVLNAQECLQWGIVNTVVPDTELMAHVERLAVSLAGTADAREGVLAFTQKRKPEFLP